MSITNSQSIANVQLSRLSIIVHQLIFVLIQEKTDMSGPPPNYNLPTYKYVIRRWKRQPAKRWL